ncbi:hypothetical protein [Oceanobacter antarcticus]|uniref:Uncharacterized protein n=1 Tax=Oceanobacter antarcticus TaxID=3133425 RepID=A0ABW8NK15_9GAMM
MSKGYSIETQQQLLALALKFEIVAGHPVKWRNNSSGVDAMLEYGLSCDHPELRALAQQVLVLLPAEDRQRLVALGVRAAIEATSTAAQTEHGQPAHVLIRQRRYRGATGTLEDATDEDGLAQKSQSRGRNNHHGSTTGQADKRLLYRGNKT